MSSWLCLKLVSFLQNAATRPWETLNPPAFDAHLHSWEGAVRGEQVRPGDATVELLEEIGYTRLTIPLVAARAGATPPAVYRRFPTKIELVYAAVFPDLPSAESALAGDLESAVRALIRASIDLFSRPAVHTAISGLMAEMPSEPGLSARLLSRFQADTYILLHQFLDNAAAEGRAAGGVDARLFLDMISGTVMMSLANERNLDDACVDQTTALTVRGLAR
jgi:AcrR family transcriptional regulator